MMLVSSGETEGEQKEINRQMRKRAVKQRDVNCRAKTGPKGRKQKV